MPCVFVAGLGLLATTAAQSPEQLADSYRLVAEAHAVVDRNPGRGLLLAIEGHRLAATRLAREAIARALRTLSEERTLRVSPAGATSAQLSPDGKRIVTTSNDGWIAVWDRTSGALLAERVPQENRGWSGVAESATFSPDGRRLLLTYGGGPALLWDLDAPPAPLEHEGGRHRTRDRVADFAAGGRLAVVGVSRHNGGSQVDQVGHVFDVASRELRGKFEGSEPRVCKVGTHFATFDSRGKRVLVHSVEDLTSPKVLELDDRPLGAILSAAGDRVYVNANRAIRAFDVASGELIARYDADDWIWNYAVTPERLILGTRTSLHVVNLDDGERIVMRVANDHRCTTLAVSGNGALAAVGRSDGAIEILRLADGMSMGTMLGHDLAVHHVSFDREGRRVVSASADGTARIWRIGGPQTEMKLAEYVRGSSGKAALAPDTALLAYAGSYRDGVPIWDLTTGDKIAHIPADHPGTPKWLDDGNTLLLADSDTTRLWCRDNPTELRTIADAIKNSVSALRGDGKLLAVASDDKLELRNLDAGTDRDLEFDHEASALRFADRGKRLLVASYRPRTLACFDCENGSKLWQADLPEVSSPGGMLTSTIAASGSLAAVSAGTSPAIHLVDLASGEVQATLLDHTDQNITGLHFSPDGSRMVSVGGDWTVRLWNTKSHECLRVTRRARGFSFESWWDHAQVDFSPDGLYYAFAFQQENVVQVRSSLDGALAWRCQWPRSFVQSLAFDEISQYLFVTTRSGRVFRYPAIPLLRGKRQRPRQLLPDEFAAHVLDEQRPDHAARARSYALQFLAQRPLPPVQERELLWSALTDRDVTEHDVAASLTIVRRLAKRTSETPSSAALLALCHLRGGDSDKARASLGEVAAQPADHRRRGQGGEPPSEAVIAAVRALCALHDGDRAQARNLHADLVEQNSGRNANAIVTKLVSEIEDRLRR